MPTKIPEEQHTEYKETLVPVHHPVFAVVYERLAGLGSVRRILDPLRQETAGQAHGLVLEVGAGTGLNFPLYVPGQVERVEAVEPDAAMLRYARHRLRAAHVPITLTQAPVEALPFADETFDSAVVTLVFCSGGDPVCGLREIKRVLKPGGMLLMAEHVQSQGAFAARVQAALVPLTTRFGGNCHWNRDTARTVTDVGFQITHLRRWERTLQPFIVLHAIRP